MMGRSWSRCLAWLGWVGRPGGQAGLQASGPAPCSWRRSVGSSGQAALTAGLRQVGRRACPRQTRCRSVPFWGRGAASGLWRAPHRPISWQAMAWPLTWAKLGDGLQARPRSVVPRPVATNRVPMAGQRRRISDAAGVSWRKVLFIETKDGVPAAGQPGAVNGAQENRQRPMPRHSSAGRKQCSVRSWPGCATAAQAHIDAQRRVLQTTFGDHCGSLALHDLTGKMAHPAARHPTGSWLLSSRLAGPNHVGSCSSSTWRCSQNVASTISTNMAVARRRAVQAAGASTWLGSPLSAGPCP
jgi:hypothetical protein